MKLELNTMTPAQQRIAIAKACGWKKIYKGHEPDNRMMTPDGRYSTVKEIPDYTTDLNAMHEAEKVLFACEIKWARYRDEMHKFYLVNDTFSPSAAQRAEAFLKTLGKWTS